jgi:hypothetical protein
MKRTFDDVMDLYVSMPVTDWFRLLGKEWRRFDTHCCNLTRLKKIFARHPIVDPIFAKICVFARQEFDDGPALLLTAIIPKSVGVFVDTVGNKEIIWSPKVGDFTVQTLPAIPLIDGSVFSVFSEWHKEWK